MLYSGAVPFAYTAVGHPPPTTVVGVLALLN